MLEPLWGVGATVLWTAFTGFYATVGAVAFFAALSVLSNLFCALIHGAAVQDWRLYRRLLDTAENPGAKGAWWTSTCFTPR